MNKLTLFWSLGSQPGRAVKTLLDIGHIPHEPRRINVPKMQHKGEEFLKINPLGMIPAIKDGEFTLGESNAIMTYLCEKHPSIAHWHGRDIYERAIVNQYLSWYQGNFRIALFKPFRKFLTASITGSPLNQPQILKIWKQMWETIEKLDTMMLKNQTEFIAGKSPSIADLLFFYELSNLVYFRANHQKYRWISGWYQNIYAIPQVSNIMKEWQIFAEGRAAAFTKIMPINDLTV